MARFLSAPATVALGQLALEVLPLAAVVVQAQAETAVMALGARAERREAAARVLAGLG